MNSSPSWLAEHPAQSIVPVPPFSSWPGISNSPSDGSLPGWVLFVLLLHLPPQAELCRAVQSCAVVAKGGTFLPVSAAHLLPNQR